MTLTSDAKQRKQRSQHNSPNPNNSYKTKKNFTGFYTEVNPIVWNLIPKAIRDASSQQLFKQKLRQVSRILDQIQFEKEACQITSKQMDFLYF